MMTYQVLARKWRPRTFSELVGQQHVLKALTNALDKGRIHHAFIFTGTRGVGKTTLARIMAKALNCEKGVSATPCLTCQSCLDIEAGSFVDLIEIDAASRTKVEDTREILENVQYRPNVGRYKIYLIDEVHMLSTHSFNALLKTLEEPPSYVIFILATTDQHKIPVTVLSRCLQFTLKHLLPEQIAGQLEKVCDDEKKPYDPDALMRLAKGGEGSMRDALSLLDQAIAYSDGAIDDALVREMLGFVSEENILQLMDALLADDGVKLIEIAQSLALHGADLKRVLDELIDLLHQVSIVQCIPNFENSGTRINGFAEQFSKEEIQLLYQIALKGREDLIISTSYRVGFEMTLLRMLAFKLPSTEIQKEGQGKKISMPSNDEPTKHASFKHKVSQKEPMKKLPDTVTYSAPPQTTQGVTEIETAAGTGNMLINEEKWPEIVNAIPLGGMGQTVLTHCCFIEKNDRALVLGIEQTYQAMLTDNIRERIEKALNAYLGESLKLKIKLEACKTKTPAQIKKKAQAESLSNAKEALEKDPCLKDIIEQFDGKIDEASIKVVDETL